jgi:transposase InsO family protein
VGIEQGWVNRQATRDRTGQRNKRYQPRLGHCFVHTVIDDYSRVAYAEIHDDEKAVTAVAVLHRAVTWFAERGVTVERVLSDNGSAYVSHLWRDSCAELGVEHKRTRPRRPQTNGKIERLHRTLADGWAYKKLYTSEKVRRAALPGWLHQYNQHRPHSALGGLPPITRLDNLAGHHS